MIADLDCVAWQGLLQLCCLRIWNARVPCAFAQNCFDCSILSSVVKAVNGAHCHDGEGFRTISESYVENSIVPSIHEVRDLIFA